jgi:ribonuclease HII
MAQMKSRFDYVKAIGKLADALTQAVSARSVFAKEDREKLSKIRDELNRFLGKELKNGLPRKKVSKR